MSNYFEPITPSQSADLLASSIKSNGQYYLATSDGGQPGQTIQVNDIVAICQQSIPPGPIILVNQGQQWYAYAPRINQESSTRVVQNSRRRRRDRDQFEPGYAILYSVSKETVVEYWVATDTYEVQVFSLDKVRGVTTPLPPGGYLAVWGDINYAYEGEIFSNTVEIQIPDSSFFTRVLMSDLISEYLAYEEADSIFGTIVGVIKTIRMPTPQGLKPRFTGEFVTGGLSDFFRSVYSSQPLTWDHTNSSISFSAPSDAITRGTYMVRFEWPGFASSGGYTDNFNRFNQTLWEFTGETVIEGRDFFKFTWQPSSKITSKGFSKDDLMYINTRIYAPANVNVAGGLNHYTVGIIPYDQVNPGSAYPLANRLSIDEGSNAVRRQAFFPGEQPGDIVSFTSSSGKTLEYAKSPSAQPALLINGRDSASPDAPQVFYTAQTAEAYLSSVGKSAVFFIKYENTREDFINERGSFGNANYKKKEYKIIESDGTINPFGEPSNQDISNVNSEPIEGGGLSTPEKDLARLNLLRYGFKEWKAYLTSMTRTFGVVFSPVGSANPNDNIVGQTNSRSLRFSGDFFGRHKVAAANILSPGVHVDEGFYLAAPFGEIVDFLEDEDNDAESTASFTFENIRYTIGTTDPPPSGWPVATWVNHIVSEDEPAEYTVDIIKPVELAKFLADDSGDIEGVTIIDIIPLVEE